MTQRYLTLDEIHQLQQQGCTSTDWQRIRVAHHFKADYIFHTYFAGDITLGVFEKEYTLQGGLPKHAGIFNASLYNCTIADNVLIENISNHIANYDIEQEAIIRNVNLIVTDEESSFGNGTLVSVLNETGGREVPIFNELSAHLAYIIALYRHDPQLTEQLKRLVQQYVHAHTTTRGHIAGYVQIYNAGSIQNVQIGAHCIIEGASRLKNGTINSNQHAPVYIGHNVIAEDFIISSGSTLQDGVALMRCFIGQASHLGHLFSAHDSLFFSNCQGENGEACAVFAGPYTVSMHKSSLLIAGMFSFLNAGSGSNQSNHLYKLGPIHQGIIERGSKTTSDSYLLWPAKVGAFSLIMGRHVSHPDTSNLPFSYLIEQNNKTYLVPGVNLRSVGTIRDAQKWPQRDKRTDIQQLDHINFNLLSPYTIQKMLNGLEILKKLQQISGEAPEEYAYQSMRIKNQSLQKGIRYYTMAIHKFLGNSIIKRLENIIFHDHSEIQHRLIPDTPKGHGTWIDLSGLIAPQHEITELIQQIKNKQINSIEEILQRFHWLHQNYYTLEWTWAWDIIQQWYNVSIETITVQDIIKIVHTWQESVVSLDRLLYEDAQKEFSMNLQTGFGVDGDPQQKTNDFEQVRGTFEHNPFVKAVKQHIQVKTDLGNELINRLKPLLAL